jgi:phosphatidylethanolamine-binding protein (PEBP) family uncharacterized protein
VGLVWWRFVLPVNRGRGASETRGHRVPWVLAGIVLPVLAVAGGCGSSSTPQRSATASERSSPAAPGAPAQSSHSPSIGVATGARAKNNVIWPRYTCYGENASPQLSWKGLPGVIAGAKEVLIVVRTLQRGSVSTNWAVAGISPSVDYFPARTLPKGAIVGRNSFGKIGYSVCPSNSASALVTIGVYALPTAHALKSGFDVESLRTELASPEVQWGSVLLLAGKGKPPGP